MRVLLGSAVDRGAEKVTGGLTAIDLVAAGTNALDGAIPCRPLRGRTIAGRSERELRDLGRLVEAETP